MSAAALGCRAGRGALWSALQNGAKSVVDLGVFVLLAQRLVPADFGLVALAAALLVLLNALVALGVGEALLQRAELEAEHLHSAFWSTLGAAAALTTMLLLVAAPLAIALGQPALAPLLRALAPLLLLQALAIVPQALLQRALMFRPLALRALAASVCGGAAGVALAGAGAGAWSLVAQQLVAGGVGWLALRASSRWSPRWVFSRAHAAELFGFGRSVIGARLLNIGASKLDDLVVGLILGPVALGLYSVACRMLLALEQLFCQGIDAVALAAFSRLQDRRDELRAMFLRATGLAAAIALPIFGGLALLADDLVGTVFGAAWRPAAPVLAWLLVAGAAQALLHFNHAVFRACGEPALSLHLAAASAALGTLLLVVAAPHGVVAVAIAHVMRCLAVAPLGLLQVRRLLALPMAGYFRPWRVPLAGLLPMTAAVLALRPVLPDSLSAGWRLALLLAAAAAAYGLWLGAVRLAAPRNPPGGQRAHASAPIALAGAASSYWRRREPSDSMNRQC